MSALTRYFAACPKGLESLLLEELRGIGAIEVKETVAGVYFAGAVDLGLRACVWSRLASRVLLPLAEFDAPDDAALYEGTSAIDWDMHLRTNGTFAVDAHGTTKAIANSQYAAQRIKDAIADQFRARHGARPDVDRERPQLRVHASLRKERARISVDLSGGPLFMRGYRRGAGDAPLKENLGAAMLLRAQWPSVYAAGGALVDPMCGAGTLLIEAALMAGDVAPGLVRERARREGRTHWGFADWLGFDAAAWDALLAEAQSRSDAGLKALRADFHGADVNAALLGAVKQNAQAAGVSGFIQLAHRPVARLEPPKHGAPGLVICNPPYGERLGEVEALKPTYAELGDALRRGFTGWRAALITNNEDLGRATGMRADRKYVLWNGALECTLLCFDSVGAAPKPRAEPRPLSEGAIGFRNRLLKNQKHLAPKFRREDTDCWRVYDADLPDYAAAIDRYGEWLHVQEYAPPKEIEPETAKRRFGELVRVASEALGVPRERMALKQRKPQTREAKYQRHDERNEFFVVRERGLELEVNLFDYLDTGLFLDHRLVRARLRDLAQGKRFLNLFCYTASATVHAAAGGASETTSVDLSANYLEWGSRNLARNGFAGAKHRLVQADTLAWLRAERGMFDLVFVDPPTFSNSKRADDFDVQRDHVALVDACMARVAPGGLLVFSNNFRRFRLAPEVQERFLVVDVTARTIPADFARDQRIHHCFEIRRR